MLHIARVAPTVLTMIIIIVILIKLAKCMYVQHDDYFA